MRLQKIFIRSGEPKDHGNDVGRSDAQGTLRPLEDAARGASEGLRPRRLRGARFPHSPGRGSGEDHQYFWLLAERTGSRDSSDALVNGVIYKKPFGKAAMLDTEIWKNNPDLWDQARIAAGARIAAK